MKTFLILLVSLAFFAVPVGVEAGSALLSLAGFGLLLRADYGRRFRVLAVAAPARDARTDELQLAA